MSTNTAYTLTPNSQKLIVDFIKMRYLGFNMQVVRERFKKIDQAIQLESKSRREVLEDYYSDTEIAVAAEPVVTAASFLTGLYLKTPEVFQVVTKKKEFTSAANQINTLNQENAKATGWERDFPLFFKDCVKYNFGAIEIEWEAEQTQVVGASTGEGAGSAAVLETTLREGNNITRRDPYNTFYDTSLPINLVHAKGEYSGFVERITMIELARRVEALQVTGGSTSNPVMNKEKLFNQALQGITNQYYEPVIRPEVNTNKQGAANTMSGFFGLGNLGQVPNGDDKRRGLTLNEYEYTTVYVRIIPSMFNMNIPGGDKVQIWKFRLVNWSTLISAEKQTNAHNFFGLVTNQVLEEGLKDQNKSLAELLIPIQNLSTKLHDARLNGIRRNISDRGIFVQGVIDKQHIDNNSPTAKIPMRPNLIVKSARDAYFPIPYNDNLGTTVLQELGYLQQLADKTAQTNAPQRGQFQKGNKTLGEFNEIMNNADSNMRAMALQLEASCMAPIKTMLMTNILQYSPPQELSNTETGETIQLNPAELRKAKMSFKVADGLRTKDTLLGAEGMTNFMNMILQVPMLQQEYDVSSLISYMFSIDGADIDQFKYTPEQKAQFAAAQPPASAPTP